MISTFLGKTTKCIVAIGVGLCSLSQGTHAMSGNSPPDGNDHPAVVALLMSDGEWARPFCSGMLISSKVVATASHCLKPALYFQQNGWQLAVTNDATLARDNSGWLPISSLTTVSAFEQIVLNPAYNPRVLGGYDHDVSAIVLSDPIIVNSSALPTLPPVGMLTQLKKDKVLAKASFTVLGYGSEEKSLPANSGPSFPFTSERRVGILGYDALDTRFIHQSQRVSQGSNGACYGDSGGPSLLQVGQTTYLVGVTSSGDMPCFATNTATRTDTADGHDLLLRVLHDNPDNP